MALHEDTFWGNFNTPKWTYFALNLKSYEIRPVLANTSSILEILVTNGNNKGKFEYTQTLLYSGDDYLLAEWVYYAQAL